jgi:hypothetical protein
MNHIVLSIALKYIADFIPKAVSEPIYESNDSISATTGICRVTFAW